MHDVEPAAWTGAARDLWARIEAHDFEPADQALHFMGRLARDRRWTLGFTRSAIREYRRFSFLAVVSPTPVTPSEEIDEIWHQHLIYSRDYWEHWCRDVLRQPLHHDPTRGGAVEQSRFRAQYADTLALYEAYFGPPDETFWPGTEQRFRSTPRFRTVDLDRMVVFPCPSLLKRWLRRSGAALGLSLPFSGLAADPAAALPLDPLDWTAEPFLALYVALAVVTLGGAWLLRNWICDDEKQGQPDGLDLLELAYLAGGQPRAADTVIVGLIEAGAAAVDGKTQKVMIDARGAALLPFLEPFRTCVSGLMSRQACISAVVPRLDRVKMSLIRRNLAPAAARTKQAAIATVCLIGPVLALGLAKVLVGLSRDKSVGFLLVLLVLTGFGAGWLIVRPPQRTREGDAALRDYRDRQSRAVRAPRPQELMLAFALVGPAALAGTALAAYAGVIKASGGSGGCGASSGCGGGGGCGGCGGG